jgi:hypothetical protein
MGILNQDLNPDYRYKAGYLGADTLRSGLVGTLAMYVEGAELLSHAVGQLRTQFKKIRIIYNMELQQELAYLPYGLRPFVEYTGRLDDEGRDEALTECNVAYLPGRLLAPEIDATSRHSIPSRSLDFTSIRLPMIAARRFTGTVRHVMYRSGMPTVLGQSKSSFPGAH